MNNTNPCILIIDDEKAILQTLKASLCDENFYVETLNDGTKAIDVIGKITPDLVLLDIFMPNCNGLELLEQIKKIYPQQKVIIISGFGTISIALEALKNGALDFFEKPLNFDEILAKINFLKAENHQYSPSQNKIEHNDFSAFGLIGASPLFLEFMQQINQIAKLRYPLLIYGHHGTGKTTIARYVHHVFFKGKHQLHTIDCLATQDLINNITAFNQGTIYFKNIDHLSNKEQKIVLAFLERNDHQQKNSAGLCKVIASSTQPLFKLCVTNHFIPELFHKLNVTPLETIPLSKRRYDIPLLTNYFLEQANTHHEKKVTLSNACLQMFKNHAWQSNITALKQLIDILVAQVDTYTTVTPEILSLYLNEKETVFVDEQFFIHYNSLQEATMVFEKKFLSYTLKKNRNNLHAVSEKLNINLADLHHKLSKLDINYKN